MRLRVPRRLLPGIVGLCVLGTLHAADLRQSVFRSGIDLVRVYVTVTDEKGRLVTTLDRSDFEVFDNGRPQPAIAFSNTPQPIRLVLLLDVSGSMSGNVELLKSGAEHLFTRLRPDDVALVGTFGSTIAFGSGFTNDVRVLRSALPQRIVAGAQTPLWWAVHEGIREFESPGDARRVILVLSDGKDSFYAPGRPARFQLSTLSQLGLTQADVMGRAQRNDVMVYGVGMHSAYSAEQAAAFGTAGDGEGPDPGLALIARQTGGGYAEVRVDQDLGARFSEIADELHGQYLVGFEPPERDGQVHSIDVKMLRPGLTARARQSYVAPGGRAERFAAPARESPPAAGNTYPVSPRQPDGGPRVINYDEIIRSFVTVPPPTSLVSPRPSSSFPLSPRIRMLQEWLAAVDRHEPGVADAPVQTGRGWTSSQLHQVWMDLSSVATLVHRPGTRSFATPALPASVRAPRTRPAEPSRRVTYTDPELAQLQAIANQLVQRGGANRMLQRGALLHADIAMLAPPQGATYQGPGAGGSSQITLNLTDGQQSGLENVSNHWEMGRRLLDQVRPEGRSGSGANPGADPMVRVWYLTASAFMQGAAQFSSWHIERSLQLFPRDPDTLFLAGCFHEALSAAHVQTVVHSKDVSNKVRFDVGNEAEELREAERLFRQTLEIRPTHVEARLRRGRVLGRLGLHKEAASELRSAADGTVNLLLLYYANLFLGGEAEALGRPAEARDAYQAAAALFPRAQSSRFALSTLATRAGDPAEAAHLIEGVLDPGSTGTAYDPWWDYYTAPARSIETLLPQLRSMVRERK